MSYPTAPVDLWQIPYQTPPAGQVSNFNARSDLTGVTISLVTLMLVLTTLSMFLRMWIRFENKGSWRMDDWFASAAYIMTAALGALLIPEMERMGKHTWDVSLGLLMTPWSQKIIVASGFLAMISLFLGKLCVLALYYRIFNHITHVRWEIYASVVLALPLFAASIIMPINSAPAAGTSWGTPNPHNDDNTRVSLAVGIINLLVDLFVLYIPIPIVLRMNLSLKRKIGVLAMFLTGLIALAADIVIMYFRVELYRNTDPLRHGIIVTLCAFVEAEISVIISSMPSIAKFWRNHIGGSKLYSSFRSKFLPSHHKTSAAPSVPSHIRKPEPVKKKKRGLYSIPTLPTTNLSTTQLNKDGVHTHYSTSEMSCKISTSTSRPSVERNDSLERDSLAWNDPSNLIKDPSPV